ncbi:MAG: DISARM system helicase DrmA, partial [Planctomycetes bacterium]|nr:DISARM system helicase DrmA [Planctomycetota bacterium]
KKMDIDQFFEEEEIAMLYRHDVEFAVGHGVAVHATTPDSDPWHAVTLETVSIPSYDVPQQTAAEQDDEGFEELAGLEVSMNALARADKLSIGSLLNPITKAYASWIKREEAKLKDPEERLGEFAEAVKRTVARCRATLKRIQAGIDLLTSDEIVFKAFQFANEAMYLQRIHGLIAESQRRHQAKEFDELDASPGNYSWRPFQLAFLLLNLESVTDLKHKDRSDESKAIAELLWFPTGGGKTEAYLGLSAYVMAIRRLQGVIEGRPGDKGLAVLMRYTLRLLTLQQFQRAASLICACEKLRRDAVEVWGTEPFRLGLWVGQKSTPNTTEQAAHAVNQERGNSNSYGSVGSIGSPAQLTNCPWCGWKIDPGSDIEVESNAKGRGRTLIYCSNYKCLFGTNKSAREGIPVVVVDEEIYQKLPTMMIATVDKFAQMPWNGRTQMLFGHVDEICPRHGFKTSDIDDADSHPKKGEFPPVRTISHPNLRPPDLIIQDELHLISGPLGSLVGLYETAIDELCSWTVDGKKVRPKIIASTATVRNAKNQVRRLFQRNVEIFPPPGTSAADNFFSIRRPTGDAPKSRPGRRYIGICAPGKSIKAALIRVYTAQLSAAQLLYDKYGKLVDPWMTLVGYFNSLRELAGMRRLVEDDVQNRLRHMDQHGLAKRKSPFIEELTSRKSSTDIPRVLDLMEAVFDPLLEADRAEAVKAKRIPDSRRPIDVLLATNMISVGVDIKRLGLMVVGGQPKNTSEYIQATSRVGRDRPGLVCTVYNWARPRDLSHYERFEHYHATFYQQVEAISVTPFAARALDRGLTAIFVTLVRLAGREFNGNEQARNVDREHQYVKNAIETIVDRIKRVEGSDSLGEDVRQGLKQRLDEWMTIRQRTPTLSFKGKRDGITVNLLQSAEAGNWDTFTCLNSLRDVEESSSLILIEDGM